MLLFGVSQVMLSVLMCVLMLANNDCLCHVMCVCAHGSVAMRATTLETALIRACVFIYPKGVEDISARRVVYSG